MSTQSFWSMLVVIALGTGAQAGGGAVKGIVTDDGHAPAANAVVMLEGRRSRPLRPRRTP